jgi:hypothetical protein
MLSRKTLLIALSLVFGAASGAMAATKSPVKAQNRAVASAYASAATMNAGAQQAWFDRAKGNIDGF